MHIQVNTDTHIDGGEQQGTRVRATMQSALTRFVAQITRVEVHLIDENSRKGGYHDVRCTIEARVEGRPPTAVSHRAGSVEKALNGAAGKLTRLLGSTIERRRHRQRGSKLS